MQETKWRSVEIGKVEKQHEKRQKWTKSKKMKKRHYKNHGTNRRPQAEQL